LDQSIKTLLYYKPQTGMRMTELMIYDWSLVSFQDCQNVFPGPPRSPPTFKYKDKQQ